MKQRNWITVSFSLALFTAGCATGIQLEGLDSLAQQVDPTTSTGLDQLEGPLEIIANEAEASAPFLDIVQISIDAENDLVVFALLAVPPSGDSATGDPDFQIAVEAIWRAAAEQSLPVNNVAVAFMQVFPVNTLDRGLAPGGWLIGAVIVPIDSAEEYLSGNIDEVTRADFWVDGPVESITLDQPYAGVPNHPLRSLEA